MGNILEFEKFHGAGNDFIMLDGRDGTIPSNTQIAWLCDRHFGVGADGLIILNPQPDWVLHMRYFNADGGESTMCGNGGRCAAAWAHKHNLAVSQLEILASDGNHKAEVIRREGNTWEVRLSMGIAGVPVQRAGGYFINTGSPHHIGYTDALAETEVHTLGQAIRNSEEYAPAGTNVNFVERTEELLLVRTFERGVEAETLACGTGTTAVALTEAWLRQEKGRNSKLIKMPGGLLSVDYEVTSDGFRNVWLQGPASFVFKGEIDLPENG